MLEDIWNDRVTAWHNESEMKWHDVIFFWNLLVNGNYNYRRLKNEEDAVTFLTCNNNYRTDYYFPENELHVYEEKIILVISNTPVKNGYESKLDEIEKCKKEPIFTSTKPFIAIKQMREWCGTEHPEACDTNDYWVEIAIYSPASQVELKNTESDGLLSDKKRSQGEPGVNPSGWRIAEYRIRQLEEENKYLLNKLAEAKYLDRNIKRWLQMRSKEFSLKEPNS